MNRLRTNHLVFTTCIALWPLFFHSAAAQTPPPVRVQEVETRSVIENVRATGTVTAARQSRISTAVGGLVASIHADVGDHVEIDDLIVALDSELQVLALGRLQADREQAVANRDDARRRLREAEQLGADGTIAQSEIESRRAAVAMADAAHAAAGAAVEEQQARVRRHRIAAPFAGTVTQRFVDLGEWVSPGTALVQLVADDRLWLDFQMPQSLYPRINRQTELSVAFEALDSAPLAAQIHAIVPAADPTARTFLLRARLNSSEDLPLTPGMSAQANLTIDTGRTAPVISRDALVRYPDGRNTVWVVNGQGEQGKVAERQVSVGLLSGATVEVREGLSPGERVVTHGNEALQEGQSVTVQSP